MDNVETDKFSLEYSVKQRFIYYLFTIYLDLLIQSNIGCFVGNVLSYADYINF